MIAAEVGKFLRFVGMAVGAFGWIFTRDAGYLIPFTAGLALMLIGAVESVAWAVRANTVAQNRAIQ